MTVAVVIASILLGLQADRLGADLLFWSALGALGVGFGEEMITRGSLVVGLRSRFGEGRQGRVWLISTLLFSAMHVPNVFFGLPLWAMPFQVLLTFIMGTALYLIRRHTGTLIVPMVLHGLWDSSLFLSVATGREPSPLQFVVYPLTVLCAIAVMRREHDEVDRLIACAREQTAGFTTPPGASAAHRALVAVMAELETDTRRHVHTENEVLFPEVERLERQVLAVAASHLSG